ncbi:polysaccharide pyruvyl transferase family protein [Shimia sp. MMG029]|uniref:polysaccharide pyruvyl transferase family protein n=1 Tax=Shimia sp. MMG029 TaxID=3021978 RepID=UPI0022FF1C85|nr:polysaccharide pyruvyl transferase family protein [Shimia sp. MMG029]MDA5558141.1 polysaccharide pyruvyl transferase family protein [Shimia sp. MMG029]
MNALSHKPHVSCFNVKYSPNLGDGLLSECLEHALISCGAAPDSTSIDLAARKQYGDGMAGRGAIMAFLSALPGPVRASVVRLPLFVQGARKWRPHYRTELTGSDAMVIGGGNLLADLDLNFPTKLSLALQETAAQDIPAAIYACGMSSGWSDTGLRIARAAFSLPNLRAVFLRDAASVDLWNTTFAEASGQEARLARDPGLMACDVYPAASRLARQRPVVGLGLMSPLAIRYHSEETTTETFLANWYIALARALIQRGCEVHVFTNGSPEDRAFAETVEAPLRALGGEEDIRFVTQADPKGLCANIANFDVMIAYRMHAIIAAYSYAIPAIALAWDQKVLSFMQSVERDDWLVNPEQLSPEECATLAECALRDGVDRKTHERVLGEARADVETLFSVLR